MSEAMMTLQQAAEFLQTDPDTLRALARRGRVPAMKVGRQWRFDPALLREWIREQSLQGVSKPVTCRSMRGRGAP
jgi:excisionase family DNA binding protein